MTRGTRQPRRGAGPGRPRRRAAVILILAGLLLCTAAAVSHVWTRLKVIQIGYRLSEASTTHTHLLEINRRLRIEVALLKNPGRIARIAAEELGMQQPRPDQVRRLWLRPDTRPTLATAR